MSREDIQTNIRIPADVKDALTLSASMNRRSLSAEINARIVQSFEPPPVVDYPEFVKLITSEVAQKLGVSFNEALCILVAAGDAKDAPHVTYMRVPFGVRFESVSVAMEAIKQYVPSGSVQYGDSGD